MPKICYQSKRFDAATFIAKANQILEEYAAQGYDLTLRQLYYQFVARGFISNKDTEYKRLGSIVNDARLAGEIDWSRITDRTRNLKQNGHWDSPSSIVAARARQYQIDKWASQDNYVECWVEKDALVGVLEVACQPLDVPYFSCRGYTSQSEVWGASQRLLAKIQDGKKVVIIHLGDHDPSGIDMTRDILDRLTMFLQYHRSVEIFRNNPRPSNEDKDAWITRLVELSGQDSQYMSPVEVRRIALNMDQIEQYGPPPNPAKLTDSRSRGYIDRFGDESWELDALDPATITGLIQDAVFELRDLDRWEESVSQEDVEKQELKRVANAWGTAVEATR